MDSISYVLLTVLIGVGLYIYWDDKNNWELIYETADHAAHKAQSRFSLLKASGINCRLRTSSPRGINLLGMSSPTSGSFRLEVHKRDLEKAWKLLAELK